MTNKVFYLDLLITYIYDLIEEFPPGRRRRVVLNVQTSRWINVTGALRQSAVLGAILSVIFINDVYLVDLRYHEDGR